VAATFLAPLLHNPQPVLTLVNTRTNRTIARRLETAFDSRTRKTGLLGRTAMAPDTALILAPCGAVHTFFMRFAIDVAFVDREGLVVKVLADLRPWRVGGALGAYAAIELPAGTLALSGTARGDGLTLRPQ
jgi:uncharacterized protein